MQDKMLVTCSPGAAIMPKDDASFEELLEKADARLYKAKQRGKNQYCIDDED